MARHAEVSSKQIIDAGCRLQMSGKTPNPGAIRAALGNRGGLARIKKVWEEYLEGDERLHIQLVKNELAYSELPLEIINSIDQFKNTIASQIERVTVDAYERSQGQFEKRVKTIESQYQKELDYYKDFENTIDVELVTLQANIDELENENQKLARQNADLLLENAELKGRLQR